MVESDHYTVPRTYDVSGSNESMLETNGLSSGSSAVITFSQLTSR